MTSNHLPAEHAHRRIRHRPHFMRPGFGYGYNCAVVFDPPEANLPDGKGTFFWDGAAGTWFWVDPTNDIVFVGMIQRRGQPRQPLACSTAATPLSTGPRRPVEIGDPTASPLGRAE